MTTNIQIDYSDLTKFKKEVQAFNTTLGTLSTRIDTFSDKVDTLGSRFTEVQSIFTTIKTSITGVDTILKGVANAMKTISKVESLETQSKALERFILAVKSLGEGGGTLARNLKGLFDSIVKATGGGVTESGFMTLTTGIRTLATALDTIQRVDLSKFNKEFRAFEKIRADLEKTSGTIGESLAQGLGTSEVMDDFRMQGVSSAQEFLEGFRAAAGIHSPSTETEKDGRDLVKGLEVGIAKEEPKLEGIGSRIAGKILKSFSAIRNLFGKGGGIAPMARGGYTSGNNINGNFVEITLHGIEEIVKSVDKVSTIKLDPAAAQQFKNIAKTIIDIVQVFSEIPVQTVTVEKTGWWKLFGKGNQESTRLTNILEGIVPFMQLLSDVMHMIPTIDPNIAKAFKEIFNTIFSILKVFGDMENTALDRFHGMMATLPIIGNMFLGNTRLTKVLQGIKPFTKLINDALGNLTDIKPNAVRSVATTLRAIRDIVSTFSDKEKGIPLEQGLGKAMLFIGKSTRLTRFFQGLRPLTKLIADAMKPLGNIPDPSNLRAVSNTMETLSNVIQTFGKVGFGGGDILEPLRRLTRSSTRLTQYFEGFRPLVKLIVDAVKPLGKIKITETTQGFFASLSNFVLGISKLIDVIAKENIDSKRAGEVAKAILIISDALAEGISSTVNIKAFKISGEKVMDAFFTGAREEAEIQSPSRVMMRIAGNIYDGFSMGISKTFSLLKGLGVKFMNVFMSGFTFVRDNLGKVLTTTFNFVKNFANQVHQQFSTLAQNIRNTSRSMITGGSAAVATGGFMGFLTGNISTMVADFDQIVQQIKVFGKVTDDTLLGLQDSILDFSAATKFGPAESADAFLNLLKAGLQTKDALSTLPQVGALAAASNLNLADATTLALNALYGFNKQIEDLPSVIDTLVGGADISNASVTSLGNALGFVGQSAVALNVPIEDVTAALALLNDQSIGDERAGTGLRGIFDALAAPSAEAKTALDEMGISLKDADGNFIGLGGTIEEFSIAIGEMKEAGMGDIEIFEQLSALGDRNAVTALLALIKEGTEGVGLAFDEYRTNLDEANKATEIAAALSDTFKGKVESLKGSIETLIIKAFQPFLTENVAPLIDKLIVMINGFAKLPKPILKTVAALTVLATILTTIAGIFSIVAGVLLLTFIPALQVAAGLFALIFNPMTILAMGAAFATAFAVALPVLAAVAGALIIIVGAATKFYRDVQANVGGAKTSWNELKDSVSAFTTAIGALFSSAVDFFAAFRKGSDGVQAAADKMAKGGVSSFLDMLREGVDKITQSLTELKLLFDFFTSTQMTASDFGGNDIGSLQERQIALQDELNEKLKNGAAFQGAFNRAQDDYLIKSGDTLSQIAQTFGISMADILAANPDITDPNKIFAGRTLVLPGVNTDAPSEDIQKLKDEIAEVNQQIEDEMLKAVKGQVKTQEEQLTEFQQRALTLFEKSNLFKKLFGDDEFTRLRLVNTLGKIETIFGDFATAVGKVNKGFNSIFKGKFRAGIKEVTLGFSNIALQATNLFETITGVDISDELQKNLSEGNVVAIFRQLTDTLGGALKDVLIAIGPYIIEGAGFLLKLFLQSFGAGFRTLGSLLGITFINDFFSGLDENIITPLVDKVVETLKNAFKLGQGDISLTRFISDLFGIDDWTDQIGIMLALSDVETAVDELKVSFQEFLNESGLSAINLDFETFKELLIAFQRDVLPTLITDAIHGFANVLRGLGEVIAYVGPVIRLLGEPIVRLLENVAKAAKDMDSDKLQDIAIALGIIAAPVIIASLGGVALSLLALYFAVNILAEVIDPVLNFLQDFGDLVQAIAKGDWDAALGELRELNQDISDIMTGVAVGTINAFAGIFEAIGELAGVDMSGVVRVMDAMSAMLKGDNTTLSELLGDDIGQRMALFALDFAIGFEKVKIGMLTFLDFFYLGIAGFLNGIVKIVNELTGSDIGEISGDSGLNIEEAEASLARLENAKHVISMTVEFQETGELPEFLGRLINSGNWGSDEEVSQFIRNSIFSGISPQVIGNAFNDAISDGNISQQSLFSVFTHDLKSGDITPEELAAILPPNLQEAFAQLLRDNVDAGMGGDIFKDALTVMEGSETETSIKDAGKNLMAGIAKGIDENTTAATDSTTAAMQDIKDTINTELETQSPSLFTARQGLYLMEGLRDGIVNNLHMVLGAVSMVSGTLDILIIKVKAVQFVFQESFALAAASLDMNVTLMELSLNRLIGALWALNYAAATTLGTIAGATSATVPPPVTGATTGGTTTRGGTTPPPPPPVTGFRAGAGGGNISDKLKGAMGSTPRFPSGGGSTVIVEGERTINVTVNNANPNYRLTPEDIAEGVRLAEERNPRSRKLRNRR